jgi:hypothetical protein
VTFGSGRTNVPPRLRRHMLSPNCNT